MVTVPIMSIKPALELLRPILEADTEDYTNKKDIGVLTGAIEISDLSFKYSDSDKIILKNINLKINEGEFIAIVGESGSGKSTLLRILLGFEEYQKGTVSYNGADMKDIDIRSVRDQTGVVLQDGKIMEGSVLYNIIGTSDYTVEDAWEAARLAGCDADINNLEEKMDTLLPAGGGVLSGGQQQRIVIARALIRNPKVLILDDIFSDMDTDSILRFKATFDKISKSRTMVLVSRDLYNLTVCKKLMFFNGTALAQYGQTAAILEQDGPAKDLMKKQLRVISPKFEQDYKTSIKSVVS